MLPLPRQYSVEALSNITDLNAYRERRWPKYCPSSWRRGRPRFAWGSPEVLGAFAACAALVCALVPIERRVPEPILPYRLVRRGTVAGCLLAALLSSMAMYGVMAYVPLFVQAVIGSSATSAGAALMPLLLGDIIASMANGQLIARTGRMRPNALLGAVVLTGGTLLLWRMDTGTSNTAAALYTFVAGLGLGLMNQVFTMSVQNAVPPGEVGAATAFTQSARALGATFGVALMGVVVNQRLPPRIGAHLSAEEAIGRLSRSVHTTLEHALQPAFLLAGCVPYKLCRSRWRLSATRPTVRRPASGRSRRRGRRSSDPWYPS